MVWGWVHNFPTLKDVFTKPIDYPDEGYDTQIADWWEDGFLASEAIQEYLLAGVFVDRGDPAAVDFNIGNLTLDNIWRDLDLSSIVTDSATGVLIHFYGDSFEAADLILFRTKGNTNEKNVSEVITQAAIVVIVHDLTLPLKSDKTIQYKGAAGSWLITDITVKGWWKK